MSVLTFLLKEVISVIYTFVNINNNAYKAAIYLFNMSIMMISKVHTPYFMELLS